MADTWETLVRAEPGLRMLAAAVAEPIDAVAYGPTLVALDDYCTWYAYLGSLSEQQADAAYIALRRRVEVAA